MVSGAGVMVCSETGSYAGRKDGEAPDPTRSGPGSASSGHTLPARLRWPDFHKVQADYGIDPFHTARRPWDWGFTEDGRLWLVAVVESFDASNYEGSVLSVDGRARKHFFVPVGGRVSTAAEGGRHA